MADRTSGPWKCFHCHEVFTDYDKAAEHFGAQELLARPRCIEDTSVNGQLVKGVKAYLDEWMEHTSNGLDIMASACLDDVEAAVMAMRP